MKSTLPIDQINLSIIQSTRTKSYSHNSTRCRLSLRHSALECFDTSNMLRSTSWLTYLHSGWRIVVSMTTPPRSLLAARQRCWPMWKHDVLTRDFRFRHRTRWNLSGLRALLWSHSAILDMGPKHRTLETWNHLLDLRDLDLLRWNVVSWIRRASDWLPSDVQ